MSGHLWTDLFQIWYDDNTIKLCSLIAVWMTMMFTQGHRVMGQLELLQSFYCKVAGSSWNVRDGWWKGDAGEEFLYSCQLWIVWAFTLFVVSLFTYCHSNRQSNFSNKSFWMILHAAALTQKLRSNLDLSNHRGSHILSSWMVYTGCVFDAAIGPTRTWMLGSFESCSEMHMCTDWTSFYTPIRKSF